MRRRVDGAARDTGACFFTGARQPFLVDGLERPRYSTGAGEARRYSSFAHQGDAVRRSCWRLIDLKSVLVHVGAAILSTSVYSGFDHQAAIIVCI